MIKQQSAGNLESISMIHLGINGAIRLLLKKRSHELFILGFKGFQWE